MKAQDVRAKYLDFMKKQGHQVIPRANLVPREDPTTLFTGSGMQPLLPYLLGQEHPDGTRLVDSQTCLRAEDIDEVGDNRHTTFFEMLGNWSLGDYFKKEQLSWFWEFLVNEVGLDPNKLYSTCFIGDDQNNLPKDTESAEILAQLYKSAGIEAKVADIGTEEDGYARGIKDGERIFYYDGSKNWWSRAGAPSNMPLGEPGGPDSEMFYLFDSIEHDKSFGEHCHPNCDCGRFLEIGNSVFMEYLKTKDGFEPLPNKNVDFGAGLERIAAASDDQPDIFKISLIWPIIEKLSALSGKKYQDHIEAKRVIADHLRAAAWLAVDGVMPSNKEQGYVARRLVRRAVLKAHELGVDNGLCESIVPVILGTYEADFPEVAAGGDVVIEALSREEKIFRQTLKKGLKEFERLFPQKVLYFEDGRKETGAHNTDEKRSHQAKFEKVLLGSVAFKLYDTYGFPLELTKETAKVRGIVLEDKLGVHFEQEMELQRNRSRTATKGQFKGGLGGQSDVHKRYHTATHLLYESLRRVLGDHVIQRGSNITEDRLRFDFSHPEKMTASQIDEVEKLVNQQIKKSLPVSFKEYPTQEALDKGALGQFGDRYGDTVKIYQMGQGDDQFSFEICGGPHVENTEDLAKMGQFKITKEQSSSAGVRRIKAVIK